MPSNADIMLQELDNYLNDYADRIFQLSQENLLRDNKVDTGTLFKTGNVNRKFLDKEIVYPAYYAEWVHDGRNPGKRPPVEPLVDWVRRKLGVTNDVEARRIAYNISVAIGERGIQPTPFLGDAEMQASKEFGLK